MYKYYVTINLISFEKTKKKKNGEIKIKMKEGDFGMFDSFL